MFPLMLNVAGRLAVVVGGGPVGRRKATAFLKAGGRVRLICLDPKPADAVYREIDWHAEPYRAEHLEDACIVFAAARGEVNRQVLQDARRRGLLVNVADDPAGSDFFGPATVRRGPVTLAIGTGGSAPALARELRLFFEQQMDDAFCAWVETLAELRPWVINHVPHEERRRDILRALADPVWLQRFRSEDRDIAREALRAEALHLVSQETPPL